MNNAINQPLKKLVVYYSLQGNTKLIAERIASATGADIMQLKPVNDLNPRGFMKYLKGGFQVAKKKKPELQELTQAPVDYDIIFIGTPVWASSFAPALNTFFSMVKLENKKMALFCTFGGNKGKALDDMKRELVGNDVMGEIAFRQPLKFEKEMALKHTGEWAKKITADLEGC